MADYPIKFILEAENRAEAGLRKAKEQVDELTASTSGFNTMLEGALGALSAYAGTKGLMAVVGAYDEANRMLVQSRFYLRGMGGDTEKNISVLQRWASEVQRTIGINDEFAVLVASRLAPRINDLNKIQSYATTLLEGHRIGVLDAEQASIMLMRAAEGNTRAMTWLAFQLGITVYEFESMDSIMAKVQQRLQGLTSLLSPFDMAMAKLKASWSDLLETAGAPLIETFASLINVITYLITQVPVLGEVIKAVLVSGAGALMGWGAAILLAKTGILGLFGVSAAAAGPWGLVIGGAIMGVIYAFGKLKEAMKKEGYEMTLKGFGQFIKDTFYGIGLYIQDFWNAIRRFLPEVFERIRAEAQIKWYQIQAVFWNVIANIQDWFARLPYNIGYALGVFVGSVRNAFIEIGNFITTTLPRIIGDIVNWFSQLPGRIWNAIVGIAHFFIRIWEEVRSVCLNLLPNLINTIVNYFQQLPSRIWDAIRNIPSQVGNMFQNIGSQISAGFSAGWGYITGRQFGGYIPQTGVYLLHRGEMVTPAGRGGGVPVSITITGNTFLDEMSAVKMGDLIVRVLQRQVRI